NEKEQDDENKADKKKKEKDTSKKKDNKGKKDKKNKKDKKDKKEKEKKEETTYTLIIEENMVPSRVSQILEDNGIIDSASKFNEYLEDNDYSPYMQIGEFKLKTGMS